MTEQIRVGIIGTSLYADLMHLPILQNDLQAKIAAICGRNRERAEELAKKYDIPQVFTDYRAMLEMGELEAVIVATPDDLHYPITMAALEAGLHVLCEKPLAHNVDQARKMLDKAEEAGVKHMTYFTYRWTPHLQYLHQLIEEGYLGTIYHGQFHYRADRGRQAHYHWHYDRRRSNGVLSNLGSHMIDAARWCMGEIVRVNAHLSTFIERPGPTGQLLDAANDSAMLTLEFESGAQGMIHVSSVAHVGDHGQEQQIFLHGQAGTLEVDFAFGKAYTIRGGRHDEETIKPLVIPDIDSSRPIMEQWGRIFTEQLVGTRLFVDAIIKDRPLWPSFKDGLKVQEVIEAAIESDRQGCWVSLDGKIK